MPLRMYILVDHTRLTPLHDVDETKLFVGVGVKDETVELLGEAKKVKIWGSREWSVLCRGGREPPRGSWPGREKICSTKRSLQTSDSLVFSFGNWN